MTVRLLDVTLREAGLANDFAFSPAQVTGIASALDRAGVDIVELGYRRSRVAADGGAACPPSYIARIRTVCAAPELAVMIHPDDVGLEEYPALRAQGVSLVRFAVAPHRIAEVAAHMAAARAAGLRFTINAIRATQVEPALLVGAAQAAEALGAACFYIADSNGSLYPQQTRALTSRLRGATQLALGFHAHDHLRLAFANALIAIENGFTWIDASIGGAGKGGGNLPLELMAAHMQLAEGRRFALLALIRAYASCVAPTLGAPGDTGTAAALFGLLNLNLDEIDALIGEARTRGVPIEEIAAERLAARVPEKRAVEGSRP